MAKKVKKHRTLRSAIFFGWLFGVLGVIGPIVLGIEGDLVTFALTGVVIGFVGRLVVAAVRKKKNNKPT